MKNGYNLISILSILFIISSCLQQKEQITPIAKVMTLAELQREYILEQASRASGGELSSQSTAQIESTMDPSLFYINLKYQIKELDVFETTGVPNSFEQIGHSLLSKIAQFLININGSKDIAIDPIDLNIPKLNLDTSIIKSIQIKNIFIKYSESVERSSDYYADFSFIKSIELSREIRIPTNNKVDSLYLTYYKVENKCLFKCLKFNILNSDLLSIMKENGSIKLKPNLSIVSLPKVNDLTLDGTIEIKIGLKLPF